MTATTMANPRYHVMCNLSLRPPRFCRCHERSELVKGYEVAKDQYVQVTDEELKALEGAASKVIDIAEFVPLARVDRV
jgi:DNA end-binding protein Ku